MQRTLIPESQRIHHTAQLFGVHFPLRLEPTVYAIAGNLCPITPAAIGTSTLWTTTPSIWPPAPIGPFRLISPNGYQGDLSPDAFGITICLFAYSNLCFGTNQDGLPYEVFALVLLDNRHGVLRYLELFRGTIDGASEPILPTEGNTAVACLPCIQIDWAAVFPSGNYSPGSQAFR